MLLVAVAAGCLGDALVGGSVMDTPFGLLAAAGGSVMAGAWARPALVAVVGVVAAVLLTAANQRAHPGDYSVANDLFFYLLVIGGAAAVGWWAAVRRRQVQWLRELSHVRAHQRDAEVRVAQLAERQRLATGAAGALVGRLEVLAEQACQLLSGPAATRGGESLALIESSSRQALDDLRRVLGALSSDVAGPAPACDDEPTPRGTEAEFRPMMGVDLLAACSGVPLAVETVTSAAARGPAWANVVASLLIGGCLLWWRRRPVAVALAFFVLAAAGSLVLTPLWATVSGLLPLSLIAFAVGEWTSGVRRLVGTGILVCGVLSDLVLVGGPYDPEGILPTLAWLGLAIGAGVVVRRHLLREQQLRDLLARIDDGQRHALALATAEQREAMARDLHDTVAHSMTVVCLHAGAAQRVVGDDSAVTAALTTVSTTLAGAVSELRQGIAVLPPRPDATLEAPSWIDLPSAFVELADGLGVPCEVSMQVSGARESPLESGAVVAHRLLREALVNIARHAPGATARVTVSQDAEGVRLEVANRVHFVEQTLPAPGTGTGLERLQRWVSDAGGQLEHGPVGDDDYRLAAWLPRASTRTPSVTE